MVQSTRHRTVGWGEAYNGLARPRVDSATHGLHTVAAVGLNNRVRVPRLPELGVEQQLVPARRYAVQSRHRTHNPVGTALARVLKRA